MDDLSGLDWSSEPAVKQPLPPMASSFSSFRPSSAASGSTLPPLSAQGTSVSQPQAGPAKPLQDSFSNLVNFGGSRTKNLTLAERQAELEAEKRRKQEETRRRAEAQFGSGQQWDALGSRGVTPSPAPSQSTPAIVAKDNDDDDLFAAFNRDTKVDNASHFPPPAPEKKGLDLSDPTAWTAATTTTTNLDTRTNRDLGREEDDDDPFGLNEMKPDVSEGLRPVAADDEFDFLGDLARPVDEVRREQQAKQKAAHGPEPGKPIEDDSSSSSDDEPMESRARLDPFDRAVAQLVDYGFSADQARRGLVESGAGLNAQAAANWLLDEAHRKAKENSLGKSSQSRNETRQSASRQSPSVEVDLAKSAAAVGESLIKSANSLWKTGQKKMQQAVAELQMEGDPGQPKWMRDAQQAKIQMRAQTTQTTQTRTQGSVTDEALMLESGSRRRPASAPRATGGDSTVSGLPKRSPAPRRQQQQSGPPAVSDARSRLDRLKASDDGFSISTSRRRASPLASANPYAAPAPIPDKGEAEVDLLNTQAPRPSTSSPVLPQPHASPAPRPKSRPIPADAEPSRQIPPITADALQSSTRHRHQGTAHFKRGDYASAHASYTAALSSIPPKHPLMIVLLTNRALTALKTGEAKEAVASADEALRIIGPANGQGETVAVRSETGEDESREMRELYGKALSRKAEALEQMERWGEAGTVWQQCVEAGVGGATAVKGRQRCQEALVPKPAIPRAAVAHRPRQPSAPSSSEAVSRLRAANSAAVKEEEERFALTDQVDGKVSAWRDGKRDNLRALLSSLDSVLWEGSGWQRVGLHELLQPNRVKVWYMKAIAKTHPDKLPQDASTEVRLIAGLVFSTLNESWDKFKADNGL